MTHEPVCVIISGAGEVAVWSAPQQPFPDTRSVRLPSHGRLHRRQPGILDSSQVGIPNLCCDTAAGSV